MRLGSCFELALLLLGASVFGDRNERRGDRRRPTVEPHASILSCCAVLNDPLLLMAEVNSSAISLEARHSSDLAQGPSLSVGIVTFATRSIWSYAAYAFAVNFAYAQHNGYSIVLMDETTVDAAAVDADSRWTKVRVLLDALDPLTGWAKDMDYLVWVDADLVFLDFQLRLEQLAAEFPRAHILASAEHAGSTTLINSGSLVVRNSRWSRDFLRDWWTHADRRLHSDQEQFDLLYEHRRREAWGGRGGSSSGGVGGSGDGGGGAQERERLFTENIVILPPDLLNSDPPAMTQQQPHNQVLHLMGEHGAYRIRVFRAGVEEVCRSAGAALHTGAGKEAVGAVGAGVRAVRAVGAAGAGVGAVEAAPSPLAAQLTLTQPRLLQWALDVYGEESGRLMAEYVQRQQPLSLSSSPASPSSTSSPSALGLRTNTYDASQRLANSVHHYAHALADEGADGDGGGRGGRGGRGGERIYELQALLDKTRVGSAQDRYAAAIHSRRQVYHALRGNMLAWKQLKERAEERQVGGFEDIRLDWPELLKVTAIAGQHLLNVKDAALVSMRERRQMAGEILGLLQEMLLGSHPQQHDAVMLMVADVHQQVGVLDLEDAGTAHTAPPDAHAHTDHAEAEVGSGGLGGSQGSASVRVRTPVQLLSSALQHFQVSLQVTRDIADRSGQHLLVTPLTLTANALSSLRRFAEAYPMYLQALQLSERLGEHVSVIPLLVNFGISLLQTQGGEQAQGMGAALWAQGQGGMRGRCLEARTQLQRASTLIERAGAGAGVGAALSSSVVAERAREFLQIAEARCGQ